MSDFLAQLAKSLLLGSHLLAVGLAATGPLFCVLLSWRKEVDSPASRTGRQLAWLSFGGFLLGMFLGGLNLFLPPDQGYWDALKKIPAKDYWFGAGELLFSLICLLAYAATWNKLQNRRYLHAFIAVLSVTNLLYHFPPWMIVIGQLADGSAQLSGDWLDRSAVRELMLRKEVVAPWLHFLFATMTIAGGVALFLLARHQEVNDPASKLAGVARIVAGVTLVASVVQLPLGLWLVTTISQASRTAIMGQDFMASVTFLAAMIAVFILLGRLVKIALGDFNAEDLRKAALWMVLVVLAMATSMRSSRYQGPNSAGHQRNEMGHDEVVAAYVSTRLC